MPITFTYDCRIKRSVLHETPYGDSGEQRDFCTNGVFASHDHVHLARPLVNSIEGTDGDMACF